MKKVKITVLKTEFYQDLADFENGTDDVFGLRENYFDVQ